MPYRVNINGVNRIADKPIGDKSIGKFGRVYPQSQRVTATGIPSQYARAGIQATAQEYSDKFHSSLIRID